jgi:hypothetical protein
VLSATAAITSTTPAPVAVGVAVLAGLFNARAWFGMVHALVNRPPAPYLAPVIPVALAVLVAIVAVGASAGFSNARTAQGDAQADSQVQLNHAGPPVLVVSGYGSHWNGRSIHPIPGRYDEVRFSYAGLDGTNHPRPYRSADTVKPLLELARMMATQVAVLRQRTGQSVTMTAESEGALIAETYLAATSHPPVRSLVMASPLVDPGRVSYPSGQTGWGVVTRSGMEALGLAFQSQAPIDLSPTSAFVASVNREAPLLQHLVSCPTPGVRRFAVLPLADAVADPSFSSNLGIPSVVLPAFHGGLLSNPSATALISRILKEGATSQQGWWRFAEDTIRSAASAWQVPNLVLDAFPMPRAEAQRRSLNCSTIDQQLHRGVYPSPAA